MADVRSLLCVLFAVFVYSLSVCVFFFFLSIRQPPRSTRTEHAFPTRRSSDQERNDSDHKREGAIDELRSGDHGRSAAEILAGMNSAPSNSDGLVLRMDFDAVTNGRVQERVSGTSVPVLRDLAGLAGVIEGRLNVPGDTRS